MKGSSQLEGFPVLNYPNLGDICHWTRDELTQKHPEMIARSPRPVH